MSRLDFTSSAAELPPPLDSDAARVGIERWREAVEETGDPVLMGLAADIVCDPATCRLLHFLFGNSPYLCGCRPRALIYYPSPPLRPRLGAQTACSR